MQKQDSKGVIALITLLILMGVGILGIAMIITSQLNTTAANNYSNKIRTYYAADGLMTLLAQDVSDFNEASYLQKRPHSDIGSPLPAGSYGFHYDSTLAANTVDTLRGGGKFGFGTVDKFHYSYCLMSGTLELTVKLVAMKASGNKRNKAGIMIRQNLSPASRYAMTAFVDTVIDSVRLESRRNNISSAKTGGVAGALPGWLKLNRNGALFQAYYSIDGVSWTLAGRDTITMIDPVYVGLAVGSGDITYLDTAVFTNTGGIPINLRIDSTTVGRLSTPAKYNLYQLSRDVFAIATEGYAVKGATPVHAYATKLSQTLERQRTGTWTSSASGTALVPVTLYDMRADMSNPEFNVNGVEYAPCPPCTWSGKYMSAHIIRTDTLTADRKPMKKPLNAAGNAFRTQFMSCWSPTWYFLSPVNRASIANDGQTPACVDCESAAMHIDPTWPWCFNDSMHTWFRPYGDSIGKTGTYTFNTVTGKWSGLKMRPGWTPRFPGEDTEWVCQHADPTRPFTNIIMYDTLEFVERPQGSGVFFFGDTMKDPRWFMYGTMTHSGNCVYWPKPKFMPLQNRGFGYDCSNRYPIDPCEPSWTRQNFSFTMDFHRSFSYKPGQTFAFCGDDDIFVFINNRCVIDLGGIHDQVVASVNLDTLGLTVGKTYLFDFFYTERCVGGSNILVTTNMNFLAPSTPLKRSWKCDFGSLD